VTARVVAFVLFLPWLLRLYDIERRIVTFLTKQASAFPYDITVKFDHVNYPLPGTNKAQLTQDVVKGDKVRHDK